MHSIGEKIRYLLETKKITQARLAKYVDISPSRLSNYLSNKREPDIETLSKIARCLTADLNYFSNTDFGNVVQKLSITETTSENAIKVPCKMLDAPKRSKPHRYFYLDNTLIKDIKEPLIIESCLDTYSVGIKEGALMLVDTFKEFSEDIKYLIQTGRDYKIYMCMDIGGTNFLMTLPKRKLIFANPKEKYYAVKWILQ